MRVFNFAICFFLSITACLSQTLTGYVVDDVTGDPILGAAVYIDGSSTGVATDLDGFFSLDYPPNATSKLVVSMLGYETVVFTKPLEASLSQIKLSQKPDELPAVVLFNDPWTRARKEAVFKAYFLGRASFIESCSILNLNKVQLVFNPETAILQARCDVPVMVENKHLGYLIAVDLESFEAHYRKLDTTVVKNVKNKTSLKHSLDPYQIKILSTSFFQELASNRPSLKKRLKNRTDLFPKTKLYFYRALCEEKLEDAGFTLYHEGTLVSIKDNIKARQLGSIYHLGFRHKIYVIKDKYNYATVIIPHYVSGYMTSYGKRVDEYGMITNEGYFTMQGYLAALGMATALPSNYEP